MKNKSYFTIILLNLLQKLFLNLLILLFILFKFSLIFLIINNDLNFLRFLPIIIPIILSIAFLHYLREKY